MSKSDRTDVIHTLVIDPFLSATLFVGAVIFVFSVSRLFRGKGSLLAFAITSGWGGIYNIASAILLVPVFPISQSMGNQTPGSPAYMILALLALLSILGVVFATFRLIAFQVRVISRICELRVGVAIFVFIATAIPIFIIYDKVF